MKKVRIFSAAARVRDRANLCGVYLVGFFPPVIHIDLHLKSFSFQNNKSAKSRELPVMFFGISKASSSFFILGGLNHLLLSDGPFYVSGTVSLLLNARRE